MSNSAPLSCLLCESSAHSVSLRYLFSFLSFPDFMHVKVESAKLRLSR